MSLDNEIEGYRSHDAKDVRIAEAEAHLDALFLGMDSRKGNLVRTMSLGATNSCLRNFARTCGVRWPLASHQFRRKFANYAARSRFGDLRYLKQHFKHWSMDMTLAYALNEAQDLELFLEVEDELKGLKEDAVGSWLTPGEPLGGGYGERLVDWRTREETVTLFKSHAHMVRSIAESTAIRSTGHSWCTADDDFCVGNNLDPTRCAAGCPNAVVGKTHVPVYQGLYTHLASLEGAPMIGEAGVARVRRDLSRCASVLRTLGVPLQEEAI